MLLSQLARAKPHLQEKLSAEYACSPFKDSKMIFWTWTAMILNSWQALTLQESLLSMQYLLEQESKKQAPDLPFQIVEKQSSIVVPPAEPAGAPTIPAAGALKSNVKQGPTLGVESPFSILVRT